MEDPLLKYAALMEEEMKSDMTLKQVVSDKDRINPWMPLKDIPTPMYVEAIHDDYEGFRILLKGESPSSKVLRVTFEDNLSYRNTDESYLLRIWHSNKKEVMGKIFYMVENSSYIDFFYNMTEGFYSEWKLSHYAIYTVSDCVDVISASPPTVKWLN